ncbi:MAG: 3-oxoacyl-ACP reductase family protein [Zavarzinella sp.]
MISYDFSGKTVLVTGASRGIGAAIASHFANAKARVLINYFPDETSTSDATSLQTNLQDNGASVELFACDVRDPDSVQTMMSNIGSTVGKIDILVNNAGVLRDRTLRKLTVDDFRAVVDTNLDGVFHTTKFALDLLNDQGRIVNMASVAGLFPFHGQTNYAAAKAGVIAMTKVWARELARKGITVNAIAPGVVQTNMIGDIRPEMMEEYLKQIPLGRLGQPADIANAVLFLCSEESGYITGQVLPVTGGWF